MITARTPHQTDRMRVTIRGVVQGVGFRPFVYRLARELNLTGWVGNSPQGVTIELEGAASGLARFLLRLDTEKPALASIASLEHFRLDPVGYSGFEIRPSETGGERSAVVLPDIATCPACLGEIFDPSDRHYLYPFTNCTNCGPRYSILESLPYDRPNTTMKSFTMCRACRDEYENPGDRRFHAQPNACPECGPHLTLWDRDGVIVHRRHDALEGAAEAVQDGRIVAVKGLGGFHLIADARNNNAIAELRRRKAREEKPLALMSPNLDEIRRYCNVSPLEEQLLRSPECPIVLLTRLGVRARDTEPLAEGIAPHNPRLGVMLPYTPLHHILLRRLGFPVVATSGNRADEPICTDEREAITRLAGIADMFLVHNRPIHRHVDDSIVHVVCGREQVLRRARGLAPLPIALGDGIPPAIAVGAHLKNTVAAGRGRQVFLSQHIGDLETAEARMALRCTAEALPRLHALTPGTITCDMHPDYASTRLANESGLPVIRVQHHYAHVLACMAENEVPPPCLGIAWDGTGYGTDGTIWGGEFLRVDDTAFQRVAYFRSFPLPGGEVAIREPRRAALGVLHTIYHTNIAGNAPALWQSIPENDRPVLLTMLEKGINAPLTTSVGRLFDVVAVLAGLRGTTRFEGQAAMELEFAATGCETDSQYQIDLPDAPGLSGYVIDWSPMIREILGDARSGRPTGLIAARFHNTLVAVAVMVAERVGDERVVLSGGCFQNRVLTERLVRRLRTAGFRPYWHQRIPPNDGGIAVGQLAALARVQKGKIRDVSGDSR